MVIQHKAGSKVIVVYKNGECAGMKMPLHKKQGIVVITSKGTPRNYGVLINGIIYTIPCGNLKPQ